MRELCPHIIGIDKNGEEAVLAWQFAGQSSGQAAAMAVPEARQRQGTPGPVLAGGMRAVRTRRRRDAWSESISTSTLTCASCGRASDEHWARGTGRALRRTIVLWLRATGMARNVDCREPRREIALAVRSRPRKRGLHAIDHLTPQDLPNVGYLQTRGSSDFGRLKCCTGCQILAMPSQARIQPLDLLSTGPWFGGAAGLLIKAVDGQPLFPCHFAVNALHKSTLFFFRDITA